MGFDRNIFYFPLFAKCPGLSNVLSMKNMGLGPQSEEELAYDR